MKYRLVVFNQIDPEFENPLPAIYDWPVTDDRVNAELRAVKIVSGKDKQIKVGREGRVSIQQLVDTEWYTIAVFEKE